MKGNGGGSRCSNPPICNVIIENLLCFEGWPSGTIDIQWVADQSCSDPFKGNVAKAMPAMLRLKARIQFWTEQIRARTQVHRQHSFFSRKLKFYNLWINRAKDSRSVFKFLFKDITILNINSKLYKAGSQSGCFGWCQGEKGGKSPTSKRFPEICRSLAVNHRWWWLGGSPTNVWERRSAK